MNLLLNLLLYLVIGCSEWWLALRRTLACARGEKTLLIVLVFIENLLGLWVLSNFIRTNNWFLALSYSAGASLGALFVVMRDQSRRQHRKHGGRLPAKTGPPSHRPAKALLPKPHFPAA